MPSDELPPLTVRSYDGPAAFQLDQAAYLIPRLWVDMVPVGEVSSTIPEWWLDSSRRGIGAAPREGSVLASSVWTAASCTQPNGGGTSSAFWSPSPRTLVESEPTRTSM